jgi:mannose-6-phosphate isomerase-like protein (cupin superfamily)
MAADGFLGDAAAVAAFSPDKMTKQDCFRSEHLFLGLNCLRRGQSQPTHTHATADKFYLVLSGKARIAIGSKSLDVGPRGVAWAPAGVPHGIEEALEDSVIVVGMSPPP